MVKNQQSKVDDEMEVGSMTIGAESSEKCDCGGLEDVDIAHTYRVLENGLKRTCAEKKAQFQRLSKQVMRQAEGASGDNRGLAVAVGDLLQIDAQWRRLGREFGLVSPDGNEPQAFVCAGACLFALGMAAGVVLGAAAAAAGAAAS
jgi:hypothetical protein